MTYDKHSALLGAKDKTSPHPTDTTSPEIPDADNTDNAALLMPSTSEATHALTQKLRDICEDMGAAMHQSDYGEVLLRRQMHSMNEMYNTVFEKCLNNDDIDMDGFTHALSLAMRVQNQCVTTVKALSAAEYMRGLNAGSPHSAPMPVQAPPHPRLGGKQTEGMDISE